MEEYDEELDGENGSEIDMDDYDMEEESNPDNEVYQKSSDDEASDREEGEDEMEEEGEDEEYGDEEDMEDDMEDDLEDEYDEEDEEARDSDTGVNMNIRDLEKLYEMKNGKLVKKAQTADEEDEDDYGTSKKKKSTDNKKDGKIKESSNKKVK